MTAMSTSVKYFSSAMANAPSLSASAGSLVGILDACLVDGFGLVSISGIVVASGVATATSTAAHSFLQYTVALLANSTTSALNGEKRVLSVPSTTTFTFDATGVADGTYSATSITAKLAPAGWGIEFTDTHKRMYKSLNAETNGIMLRVDDSNTATHWASTQNTTGTYRAMASVAMAEAGAASLAVWTGVGDDGIHHWIKQNSSSATTARPWIIVADDMLMYIVTQPAGTTYSSRLDVFGQIKDACRPVDNYASILTAYNQTASSVTGSSSSSTPGATYCNNVGCGLITLTQSQGGTERRVISRSHTQLGTYKPINFYGSRWSNYSGYGGIAYPHPVDNGLYFCDRVQVYEDTQGIRGYLPGFNQVLHTRPIGHNILLSGIESAPGRVFLSVQALNDISTATPGATYTGEAHLDVIGPWR